MSEDTPADPAGRPRSLAGRIARLLLTLLVLGGGVAGYLFYQKSAKEKAAAAKKAADDKKKAVVTLVRVAKSRAQRLARTERYVGELAALRTVELAPKTSGRLMKLTKELGHYVRKGEVVALVDDLEIVKQLEEARAAVEVAVAQVARSNAELERNEKELDRKKPLYAQQLVTRQEMDNLESAVAIARAAVTVAQAQLAQAKARVATLEVQLDNTRVRAPFSGRVNRRYVDPGAMVTPATPLLQIVTADRILARFRVPERDLKEVPQGKRVTVRVEAYPQETFDGKVVRVSPAVDAQTRTAIAEAVLSSEKGRLKPGMFARVDVLWSVEENVVFVPQRALVRPPDDPESRVGVFVHENGTARFVPLRTGMERGEDIEVRGLPADVEVIVDGQHGLKTGAQVTVAPASGPGPAEAPATGVGKANSRPTDAGPGKSRPPG